MYLHFYITFNMFYSTTFLAQFFGHFRLIKVAFDIFFAKHGHDLHRFIFHNFSCLSVDNGQMTPSVNYGWNIVKLDNWHSHNLKILAILCLHLIIITIITQTRGNHGDYVTLFQHQQRRWIFMEKLMLYIQWHRLGIIYCTLFQSNQITSGVIRWTQVKKIRALYYSK